jgi:nicotinate-nucleotide pyrophosphorylase (carboxylating)
MLKTIISILLVEFHKRYKDKEQYLKDNNKDLKIIVEAKICRSKQIIKAGGVYKFLLDNFDFETKPKSCCFYWSQYFQNHQNEKPFAIMHYVV